MRFDESEGEEQRAGHEIIIFQSLTNVHTAQHTLTSGFLSSRVDVATICLNAGWKVFMEIILMTCLGKKKSYFLKQTNKAEIVPVNEDC